MRHGSEILSFSVCSR